MRFILASQSPRRRELLSSIGLTFDVIPSDVPEVHQPGESPEEYVARLLHERSWITTCFAFPDAETGRYRPFAGVGSRESGVVGRTDMLSPIIDPRHPAPE